MRAAPAALADGDPEIAARPSPVAVEHGKAAPADASPVDPGVVELELSYAPLWSGDLLGAGPGASTHAWSLAAAYGVAPDVDVAIAGTFASARDGTQPDASTAPRRGSGLGDLVASARWRFVNLPERALEVALVASAVLPVGSRGSATELAISQGYWSGRAALVATKDVGRWTTGAEVACAAPVAGDARGLLASAQANLAVGYHVRHWLQPELELNYQASFGADAHAVAVTVGVVVPWGGGHRIVAAVQQGVFGWNTPPTTGGVLAYKRAL
jgi:hypothetical protein